MEETSNYSSTDEDESEGEEHASRETFVKKNNIVSWCSFPCQFADKMAMENITGMTPGPTSAFSETYC